MRISLLILVSSVLMLSACNANYGTVASKSGGVYEITSLGDTQQGALNLAKAGAFKQCSGAYTTTKTEEKYVGKFANATLHMKAKEARQAVTSNTSLGTGLAVKGYTDDYFKNAFQAKLTFKCK